MDASPLARANTRMGRAIALVLYAPVFLTQRESVILAQELHEATRELRLAAFEAGREAGPRDAKGNAPNA